MGAEALGRSLLGEVEEAGLDEVFRSVRASAHPELKSSRFGIRPLDRLLHLFEQHAVQPSAHHHDPASPLRGHPHGQTQRRRASEKPPLVELTSAGPGAGKTQLLYLITAIAVLPRAYDGVDLQGQAGAVVVIDTDGHFLASRLAQVARGHIASCIQHHATGATGRPDERQPSITAAHVDSLIAASLAHVHILQPQSQPALLATLRALPAYLFSPTSHHSAHRPLHSILLDSASAFFWPTRAQEDESRTTSIGTADLPRADHLPDADITTTHPPTASDAYAALSCELRALQKRFGCAVVATTASVPSKTNSNAGPSPPLQSLRPLLPASWTASFPSLRLVVARDAVQPFAPAMSVQEAVRERAQRQQVVQRGRGSVWVDGWGSDAWGSRLRDAVRAEGAWGLVVGQNGVRVVEHGGREDRALADGEYGHE